MKIEKTHVGMESVHCIHQFEIFVHLQENFLNMNENELDKNSASVGLIQITAAFLFQTLENIKFSLLPYLHQPYDI